ncbi:MAG: RNA 3'-terminal phosphate cyclase [Gemmatimonadaceae bacterium]|nr:RNA 3'-terminal phosphate cyclase [Planctomycetota bacterium]NUQ10893.1 RNA 3'-terminal phosphate cyclase [Gemmatimonadaceae bacterium]
MAPKEIDGSRGEGGGQILRTSLALSLATGTPVRVRNIRAGREKPGLLRQHLTAVRAAAEVSGADLEGAAMGSMEITFKPKAVRPGEYRFAVGTAGSAGLVLQTILLPLCLAKEPSTLVLEGGTHNPAAPPFDFLARTWLPLLGRIGFPAEARIERHGFYPAGGGRFTVRTRPAGDLRPLDLLERGEVRARRGRILQSGLPERIAERERDLLLKGTGWPAGSVSIEGVESPGPGNAVLIEAECDALTEVFSRFGEFGVRAEAIADHVMKEYRHWLAGGVPVGRHLADQLLLPMALARGGSFRTLPLSSHSTTNIASLREFGFRVESEKAERNVVVTVAGG